MATRVWLQRHGYWQQQPYTHVFLDGGKAAVPLSVRADPASGLLRAYAQDVVAGRRVCMVERTMRGGTYRMFVDLDVTGLPSDASVAEVVREALAHAPAPLRGPGARVVVCTRPWEAGKTGAHLVWGDAHRVDDRTALALRDAWAAQLERSGGREAGWWERTLDAAVYRRNGLRMAWAHKRDGAAVYSPTHEAVCVGGEGEGEGEGEGVFEVHELAGHGHGHRRPQDVDEVVCLVARCSLAAFHPDEPGADELPFDVAHVCWAAVPRECEQQQKQQQQQQQQPKARATRPDGGAETAGRGRVLLSAAELESVRAALPREYEDRELASLGPHALAWPEHGTLTVACSSRFCLGVGREHRSNHVYFELRRNGTIVQRCHGCPQLRHALPQGATHRVPQRRFPPSKLPMPQARSSPADAAAYWLARLHPSCRTLE
jgi:hypothetical protein